MTERSSNIIKAVGDYGKGLFNFIRRKVTTEADAEDILQDVWYQLSNIDDTDEIEQLRGWLFKVARNKIIDKSRKKTEQLIDCLLYTSPTVCVLFRGSGNTLPKAVFAAAIGPAMH